MNKLFLFLLFAFFIFLIDCQSPKQENAEEEAAELIDELIKSENDTSSQEDNFVKKSTQVNE